MNVKSRNKRQIYLHYLFSIIPQSKRYSTTLLTCAQQEVAQLQNQTSPWCAAITLQYPADLSAIGLRTVAISRVLWIRFRIARYGDNISNRKHISRIPWRSLYIYIHGTRCESRSAEKAFGMPVGQIFFTKCLISDNYTPVLRCGNNIWKSGSYFKGVEQTLSKSHNLFKFRVTNFRAKLRQISHKHLSFQITN